MKEFIVRFAISSVFLFAGMGVLGITKDWTVKVFSKRLLAVVLIELAGAAIAVSI